MTHIFFKNPHSVCSFPPLSPHLVLECSWLSLLYRKGCVYVCVCVCARVRSEQGLLNMAKLCNLLNCGGLVTKLCPTLVTTWTVACQAPLSIGFSRQDYGVCCHFLLQGIFHIYICVHMYTHTPYYLCLLNKLFFVPFFTLLQCHIPISWVHDPQIYCLHTSSCLRLHYIGNNLGLHNC